MNLSALCLAFAISCPPGVIAGRAAVIDGDTLTIAGQPIRLFGIDAEEIGEPNGPAAALMLGTLTAGRAVVCQPSGESYYRIVATCFVDGQDLGAALVQLGTALDCAHYSHGQYRKLEPAGARARLRQKGYCK